MSHRLMRRQFLHIGIGGLLVAAAPGWAFGQETDAGADSWPTFGYVAYRVPGGLEALREWQVLVERARHTASPKRLALVERLDQTGPGYERLRIVNKLVNRVPYRREVGDRWLDPDRFLQTGGDCEDSAIAKYFLLRDSGVPAEDLRILVGYDQRKAVGHALLVGRSDDGFRVLDNTASRLRRPQDYPDFQVRMGFNEQAVWLYRRGRLQSVTG